MLDPYQIDIGNDLYAALWDDPQRPEEFTVSEWAQAILTAWLVAGKVEREGGMQDACNLVSAERSGRTAINATDDANSANPLHPCA